MASGILGSLKVLLSADSAQITSDLGKAKAAVKDAFGVVQERAGTAMASVTSEMGKFGGAVRGAQQGTAAAMKALELFGTKGSTVVSGMSNAIAGLAAGGFTPLGLAISGATAVLALLASESEAAVSTFGATEDRAKSAAEAVERLNIELRLLREGRPSDGVDVELAGVEAELERRRAALERIGAGGALGRLREAFSLGFRDNDVQAANRGLREQIELTSEIEHKAALTAEISERRKKLDEAATAAAKAQREEREKELAAAKEAEAVWRRLHDQQLTMARQVRDKRLEIDLLLNPHMDPAVERARSAVSDAEHDVALARARQASEGELSVLERRLESQRVMLGLVEEERIVRARLADEAAETAEADRVAAFYARMRDAVDAQAARDSLFADFEAMAEGIAGESPLVTGRTLTPEEQAAEWWDAWSSSLRAEMEANPIDLARIQEQLWQDSIRFGTMGEGFTARVGQIREETAGWGQLGAALGDAATYGLSGGVARALEEVARGSKSASEAFREFAANFAFDVARMIQQALIMKAILGMFPGLAMGAAGAEGAASAASTAGAAATPAAHGGTYRVGGFGGLDSQLVRMKLSPGELVKVSNGANSGGAGEKIDLTVVNRPAPIYADEIAARMSRRAAGGVVATAMRRAGHRGARARD